MHESRPPRGLRSVADRVLGSVVATTSPALVLTFDDGPEPGATEPVLAALRDADVQATFFVLVNRARALPGLLRETAAAGHEIALHGLDHRPLAQFSPREVYRRTTAGRRELEDLLGAPVRWFRPPYGHQQPATYAAVRAAGLTSVLWGPTMEDWDDQHTNADRVAALSAVDLSGAVVLAHDGFAGPADGVDDGPAPTHDRGDLVRRLLQECDGRGVPVGSLGAATERSAVVRALRFKG